MARTESPAWKGSKPNCFDEPNDSTFKKISERVVERWHQTLKNRVLLENCFLPGDLERQIEAVIEHYNHWRTLHSPGHG